MRDLPIPFTGPMVRARREGRKTQTRRIPTRLRGFGDVTEFGRSTTAGYDWHFRRKDMVWCDLKHDELLKALPYQVGDRLYVREAWRVADLFDKFSPSELVAHLPYTPGIMFMADYPDYPVTQQPRVNPRLAWGRHRQGMHLPKAYSRDWLQVAAVKMEQVQYISEEDAKAEGLQYRLDWLPQWRGSEALPWRSEFPREAFKDLWDSINTARGFGWDANPWVAAYTFEPIEKPEATE